MRKYLFILFLLFGILCGCETNKEHTGIEFFTLTDDTWIAITSPAETESAPLDTTGKTDVPPDTTAANGAPEEITHIYILNKGTKKFHHPTCSSVDKIKVTNRDEFTGTRADLLARGYEPCKVCNP